MGQEIDNVYLPSLSVIILQPDLKRGMTMKPPMMTARLAARRRRLLIYPERKEEGKKRMRILQVFLPLPQERDTLLVESGHDSVCLG